MWNDEKLAARAAAPELWLLRLQRASRLGPVVFGMVVGAMVFVLGIAPAIALGDSRAPALLIGGNLFFSLSCGIIAGCAAPMFRGAAADMAELRAVVPLDDAAYARVVAALSRERTTTTLLRSALGLAIGLAHAWLLGVADLPAAFALPQVTGTVLIWVFMFWTVPPLIRNALLFARLGDAASPDLLRPARHAAFGRAALRPALFIIALLCTYPVLALGSGADFLGPTLIGVAASLLSLAGLLLPPLQGIRRRIRTERRRLLDAIDARLDRLYAGDMAHASAEELFELDAVLDMRERISRAPAWPLDLAGVRRILLYIVLPPLTWAAAGLVELVLERSL